MLNLFVDVGMRELDGTERGVWMALYRDERNGVATTCRASHAERSGVTKRAVTKALRSLEDKGTVGIPKQDERGRTVDVHAMRTTMSTHLSKGGVMPRTAQTALQHSTVELTMANYTDPGLLDVNGALDVLPKLDVDDGNSQPSAQASPNLASTLAMDSDRVRATRVISWQSTG